MKSTCPWNKFKGKEVVLVIDAVSDFMKTCSNILGLAEKKREILNSLFVKFNLFARSEGLFFIGSRPTTGVKHMLMNFPTKLN